MQCNEKLQKKDPMKDLKQEGKSIRKAFLFDPVVQSVLLGSKIVRFKTLVKQSLIGCLSAKFKVMCKEFRPISKRVQ